MKRLMVISCVLALLVGLSVTAGATTINYSYLPDGTGGFKSPYAGVTTETFDNGGLLWSWSGDYAIVANSVSGHNAAPYGSKDYDRTKYITVPNKYIPGSAAITFDRTYNYFGIWWGSVDKYNTIEFYLIGNVKPVASYSGEAISSGPYGNQTSPFSNLYVNFLNLPNFNKVVFKSTSYAFEADNIAVGNVPIPGAAWLLGSGLLGLLGFRRKFVD